MKVAALASLAITLVSTAAAAQPKIIPEPKSEQAALGWSLLGTLAPLAITIGGGAFEQPGVIVLGAAGMVVGPSLGHWYAGRWVTGGLIARAGGTVLMLVGAAQALGTIECDGGCGDVAVPLLAGAVAFVGGTIYDLATAGRSARQYNARHFNLGPTVVGSATTTTLGVGVSGAF